MPGPVVQQQPLPGWLDPANATVLDTPWHGLLRKAVGLLGLDDPRQVMGTVGVPLEVGAATGGVIDALAQRYPRFASAIKAYHGSPHDFNAFDASKIGTGEGSQIEGHGLYFGEHIETGKAYRVDHATLNEAVAINESDRISKDLASGVKMQLGVGRVPLTPQDIARKVSRLEELKSQIGPTHLYEVELRAHPDQFLNLDIPLQAQPVSIIKAFEDISDASVTGREAYQTLTTKLGSQKEASAYLRRAGVIGNMYLDQGSRAVGEGTHNFVVFPGNEHLIDILKKYGIVATVAGGAAAGQSQGDVK